MRHDEKDLNKTRKAATEPRSCLQNVEKVIQTNVFAKSQIDIMPFILISNLNGKSLKIALALDLKKI